MSFFLVIFYVAPYKQLYCTSIYNIMILDKKYNFKMIVLIAMQR